MQECDGGIVEHGDENSEIEEISKRYRVFNGNFCGLLIGRREERLEIRFQFVFLWWMFVKVASWNGLSDHQGLKESVVYNQTNLVHESKSDKKNQERDSCHCSARKKVRIGFPELTREDSREVFLGLHEPSAKERPRKFACRSQSMTVNSTHSPKRTSY